MTDLKKNIPGKLLLPHFIAIIIIFVLIQSCSQSAHDEIPAPPVNITLELIPGTAEDESVVVLRLFSRKLQQQMLDGKPVSSIQLTTDDNTWGNKISFHLTKEKDETIEIEKSNIFLIRAQRDKEIAIYPQTVLQVFYVIKPTSCLLPGADLSAELALDKYKLRSNKFTIPPLLQKRKDIALRSARVNSLLNPDKLLTAAETLIREDPKSFLGYWYRGLALENNKDYPGALNSYKTALQYYPQSTKEKHYEPPVCIAAKIRRLRQ